MLINQVNQHTPQAEATFIMLQRPTALSRHNENNDPAFWVSQKLRCAT